MAGAVGSPHPAANEKRSFCARGRAYEGGGRLGDATRFGGGSGGDRGIERGGCV